MEAVADVYELNDQELMEVDGGSVEEFVDAVAIGFVTGLCTGQPVKGATAGALAYGAKKVMEETDTEPEKRGDGYSYDTGCSL